MSIKTRFSPLGYLFPKTPQVQLTISCNVSVDKIYLNDEVVAENTISVTLNVNKGLICNIRAERSGYNTAYLNKFIIYSNISKQLTLTTFDEDTLYLTINSGDDGKFIVPLNQYRPYEYKWIIDWGDGNIDTYNGTGGYNSGITHNYNNANTTYTITIKKDGNVTGWLKAFGFDITQNDIGPSSLDNKNKVLIVDGKLNESMFIDTNTITMQEIDFNTMQPIGDPTILQQTKTMVNNICAYMFQDCKNLTFGDTFTFLDDFSNDITITTGFCQSMFQGCTSLDDLKNFTLPNTNIVNVSDYFCQSIFQGCTSLVNLDDNFNLPQNITNVGTNFCYKMFQDCIALENLSNLILPQSLINMGNYTFGFMFYNCTSLNNLSNFNFPQNMTNAPQIGFAQSMFQNCTSLENLGNMKIPNITSINNNVYTNIGTIYTNNIFWLPYLYSVVPHHISYFEQTFMNCISLKTGLTSFLSNWTNATQTLIDYHWIVRRKLDQSLIHTQDDFPYDYAVFMKMFKNCSSLQENIYPINIKSLSFIPIVNILSGIGADAIYDTRETFAGCPAAYISSLNTNWK